MRIFKKLFCLLLIIGIMLSNSNISMAKSYYGNTNANINGYGQIAAYNSEIYLVSAKPNYKYTYSDDGLWPSHSYTIYKEGNNKKNSKLITNNAIAGPSLNIKSGWIYYIGISNKGKTGIYKVKTNGTKRSLITSIDMHTYRGSLAQYKRMILKDNYLYYVDGPNKIKRISITGKNKKLIYKSKYYVSQFSISENNMYISNGTNKSYWPGSKETIVKVKIDGKNAKQILSSTKSGKDSDIYQMLYYNEYIFYQNNAGIYRIKIDGSSKKCIISSDNLEDTYTIYNNKIYYTKNKTLMRCNLNGSQKVTLKKSLGTIDFICSANNKIYLYNLMKNTYSVYDIKTKKIYYIKN